MAVGDIRALKLIYGVARGLERGIQSRSQKKASIYDRFGALLEMLGKAPISTLSFIGLHFGRHLSFILGAKVIQWCNCRR